MTSTQRETGPGGVEALLVREVRAAGALTYKVAPTTSGIPDRLVIWPGGTVDFVEVKAENGTLAPIQTRRHEELWEQGANVFVVAGASGVRDYLAQRRSLAIPLPIFR